MDPERPPLPQFEIFPVHSFDKDTPATIPVTDPFNPSHPNVPPTTAQINTSSSSPYAGNVPTESPSPLAEKLEVSEISSPNIPMMVILRSLYNHP